jgi:hypothetical protein
VRYANTASTDRYREYCRDHEFKEQPAAMQLDLVRFFVKMLTDPGDLLLDPCGGGNATGGGRGARAGVDRGRNRARVRGRLEGLFQEFAGTSSAPGQP